MKLLKTFSRQPITLRAAIIGAIITGIFGIVTEVFSPKAPIIQVPTSTAPIFEPTNTPSDLSTATPNIQPITIELDDQIYLIDFGFSGILNRSIGYLLPDQGVSVLNSNCLEENRSYGLEYIANELAPFTKTAGVYITTSEDALLISRVNYINIGYLDIDPSFVDEIWPPGEFGGGDVETFYGEGGNVRPDKSVADLWGNAPAVLVDPESAIKLSLPISFSVPGVYSFYLEIIARDLQGQTYVLKTQPLSTGWIYMEVDPTEVMGGGPIEFSDCE